MEAGQAPPVPPLVVVGASAGAIEALQVMAANLPPELPAAVLVVVHVPREAASALPRIVDRAGPLPAAAAVDGEPLRPGRIVVAPPDHHVLVLEGRVRLSRGPAENGHRPAVDPLFRSAARAAGPRTVAVVLSGSRDDGTAGAVVVAGHGGTVIVQDPDEAMHPSMPRSVLAHVPEARPCPAAKLGPATAEIVATLLDERDATAPDDLARLETEVAALADLTSRDLPGQPAPFACPTCHGGLFELPGEPVPRYRCWVGHAWSPESLLEEQAAAFEGALWMALRTLEEKAALARRMSREAAERGHPATASRYDRTGADAAQAGDLIRELLRRLEPGPAEPVNP